MLRNFLKKTIVTTQRSLFLRLVNTSVSFDAEPVHFYREENALVVKLPSLLVPRTLANTKLSPIKPFVFHPVLSHLVGKLDIKSLSNEQIIDGIISIIEHQYDLKDRTGQFVGSMGEGDGGVWFLADGHCFDALDHWDTIRGKRGELLTY